MYKKKAETLQAKQENLDDSFEKNLENNLEEIDMERFLGGLINAGANINKKEIDFLSKFKSSDKTKLQKIETKLRDTKPSPIEAITKKSIPQNSTKEISEKLSDSKISENQIKLSSHPSSYQKAREERISLKNEKSVELLNEIPMKMKNITPNERKKILRNIYEDQQQKLVVERSDKVIQLPENKTNAPKPNIKDPKPGLQRQQSGQRSKSPNHKPTKSFKSKSISQEKIQQNIANLNSRLKEQARKNSNFKKTKSIGNLKNIGSKLLSKYHGNTKEDSQKGFRNGTFQNVRSKIFEQKNEVKQDMSPGRYLAKKSSSVCLTKSKSNHILTEKSKPDFIEILKKKLIEDSDLEEIQKQENTKADFLNVKEQLKEELKNMKKKEDLFTRKEDTLKKIIDQKRKGDSQIKKDKKEKSKTKSKSKSKSKSPNKNKSNENKIQNKAKDKWNAKSHVQIQKIGKMMENLEDIDQYFESN